MISLPVVEPLSSMKTLVQSNPIQANLIIPIKSELITRLDWI